MPVEHPPLRLAAALLLAAAAGAAHALPAGWSTAAAPEGGKVYSTVQGTQLRVLAPEETATPLKAWFELRLAQPVPGVTQGRFKTPAYPNSGMALATGQGLDAQGRVVILLRLGCRRPQGGLVYGESTSPGDEASFRQALNEIGEVFAQACTDGATEAQARAAIPAPRPAPAAAPTPQPAVEAPYPYVTKTPGTGLKPGEIEAILREWRNEQAGMTMQVRTYYYLLLKDGSWRRSLPPAALEDFDAAAARRGEPGDWGRWQRKGSSYELAGAGNGTPQPLRADSAREPARRGETLDGTWEISTAYSTLWSVARSHRSVSFDAGGRFSRSSGGGVVGSVGSAAAGNAVGGSVAHDDDRSSSTVGGPNFGGGSSRQRPSTLPDRSGRYRLDGYTLELRYDSGRVERLPFCATASRDQLWFDGEELSRAKPASGTSGR